jgi:hypothetical protein
LIRLEGGLGGRDKKEPIQAELLERRLRDQQVSQVHRIEGPAK